MEVAERAIPVFEEQGDDVGLSRAWRLVGQAHYLDRRGAGCAEATERALRHAQRADDRFEEVENVEWLGVALVLGPTPAPTASRPAATAAERRWTSRRRGQPSWHPRVSRRDSGSERRGRDLLARAEQIAASPDAWTSLVPATSPGGPYRGSEPNIAEQTLRPDYERLKRIGEKTHFSSFASGLARVLYAQGRYHEAAELAKETSLALRPNDVHSQIVWKGTSATILARRGELADAERLAREAVAFAQTSDFLTSHAGALWILPRCSSSTVEEPRRPSTLRSAVRLHEQKGHVVAAGQARLRLETLVV